MAESFVVPLSSGGATTAFSFPSDSKSPRVPSLVLAHGAGADQRHAFLVACAEGLASRGVDVTTFNFAYTEAKRRLPDKNDALEACWSSVLAWAEPRARGPLFIGGKSMGGRIASQVAAKDAKRIAGLVFLGYPLHPPSKPTQLRSAHLPKVRAPMMFVQGTRDAFGTPRELAPIVAACHEGSFVHEVADADHSFGVPKRSDHARPHAEVMREILDAIAAWILGTREPTP